VIVDGRVRQVGPVHEVFSKPTDVVVAASVGVETVLPGEVIDFRDRKATVRIGTSVISAVAPTNLSRSVPAVSVAAIQRSAGSSWISRSERRDR
jgi:molybdate transport system ATP-binding protein